MKIYKLKIVFEEEDNHPVDLEHIIDVLTDEFEARNIHAVIVASIKEDRLEKPDGSK